MLRSWVIRSGSLMLLAAVTASAQSPQALPAAPTITLFERHGHVTPHRSGFQHTGGGIIDVAQPSPDALVITMQGVAVAGPHPCKDSFAALDFELNQCFEIGLDKPAGKKVNLKLEARVIGLLRAGSGAGGLAEVSGTVGVSTGHAEIISLPVPSHAVSGGENLSINDHEGPAAVLLPPGRYTLHQVFHVGARYPWRLCGKAASAEFAPDPGLDPLWISYREPFHGANKKDLGLQVILRAAVN